MRERDGTPWTAGDPSAVTAEDESCLAAAVEKQDGLLVRIERLLQRLLQGPAEERRIPGLEFLAHIDDADRGKIGGVGLAFKLPVVAADAEALGLSRQSLAVPQDALGKPQADKPPMLGLVGRFHIGCGAAQDAHASDEPCVGDGDGARAW